MAEMIKTLELPGRQELIQRIEAIHPDSLGEISRAIDYAIDSHGDQVRASGELYVSHPLEVSCILADLHMDVDTIIAGLLHDLIEDTAMTKEDLADEFGPVVASLVDGVTKLRRVKRKSRVDTDTLSESQAENLRKMFLAMVNDIRVVIIKLSDRLHNMRTLKYLPPEKQQRIARETMDIFAPLANRLGIWQLKWQLEDLSFRYLDPEHYHGIAKLLSSRRNERAAYLDRITTLLTTRFKEEGIPARVTGRPKHIYSIHSKMLAKDRDFEQIYDLHGVRVIVEEVAQCYQVLGMIHTMWMPVPGEFDDYIALPKENLYQSLHTAVIALDGKPLEVQIRTEEMHHIAEYGIASHWRYKEGGQRDTRLEAKLNWLRSASDWREDVEDPMQFVSSLQSDIFAERVYIFTPKGDIVDLPRGATAVDFAYSIHSEVGHRCRGSKVDGRLVSLDYQLHTGEQVSIITAKAGGPSRDWLNPHLNYVATQRARQKIRQWFRQQEREANISAGREILERELKRLGFDQSTYAEIATLFKYSKVEDFMAALGYGDINSAQIARKIDDESSKSAELKLKAIPEAPVSDIRVMGVGDLLTRMASCCSPVPGDKIVGYITRGKGVTIHRVDCPNIVNSREPERLVQVSWGRAQQAYPVNIHVEGFDRAGLLRDIAAVVADLGLNISSVNVLSNKDHTAVVSITVGVNSVSELATLLNRLQSIRNVIDAHRERSR